MEGRKMPKSCLGESHSHWQPPLAEVTIEEPQAKQVAHGDYDGSVDKQLLIGESQLVAEQEREGHIYTHYAAHGHKLDVLTHQTGGTHHLRQAREIDAARQLEKECEEHVNPRAHLLRHPGIEHRHRKLLIRIPRHMLFFSTTNFTN